jgi:hypothetical protein
MRTLQQNVSLILALLLASCTLQAVTYDMKYEGGSLNLNQDSKMKVNMLQDSLTLSQGKTNQVIPVKSVTEISYGDDVNRRVGAAIGLAGVSLGIGAFLLLAKTKKHYVGLTWSNPADQAGKGGVVFKVGKGEYRGFLTALEGMTGLKAVNADTVGAGGTSKP